MPFPGKPPNAELKKCRHCSDHYDIYYAHQDAVGITILKIGDNIKHIYHSLNINSFNSKGKDHKDIDHFEEFIVPCGPLIIYRHYDHNDPAQPYPQAVP